MSGGVDDCGMDLALFTASANSLMKAAVTVSPLTQFVFNGTTVSYAVRVKGSVYGAVPGAGL